MITNNDVTIEQAPRPITFEQLRVGQWIMHMRPDEDPRVGQVKSIEGGYVWFEDSELGITSRYWTCGGAVWLLRDAPVPVTVRREDLEALELALAAVDSGPPVLRHAARILIDNADVGTT